MHQYKPTQPTGLPYGLRVRIVSRPDTLGRVVCKTLEGQTIGPLPLNQLERL